MSEKEKTKKKRTHRIVEQKRVTGNHTQNGITKKGFHQILDRSS